MRRACGHAPHPASQLGCNSAPITTAAQPPCPSPPLVAACRVTCRCGRTAWVLLPGACARCASSRAAATGRKIAETAAGGEPAGTRIRAGRGRAVAEAGFKPLLCWWLAVRGWAGSQGGGGGKLFGLRGIQRCWARTAATWLPSSHAVRGGLVVAKQHVQGLGGGRCFWGRGRTCVVLAIPFLPHWVRRNLLRACLLPQQICTLGPGTHPPVSAPQPHIVF